MSTPLFDSDAAGKIGDYIPSKDQTGFLSGLGYNIEEGLEHSPTADLGFDLEKEVDNLISPGDLLTESEWKKSQYFRQGIDANALKQSNGLISENVARLTANDFDDEANRQFHLQQMKSGLSSGSADFLGSLIGFTLDPINAATTVLAPELIGTQAAPLLARAAEVGDKSLLAAKIALSSTEGAAIATPQAVIDYATQINKGQPESSLVPLTSIGLGAGIGGVLRGTFGLRSIISKNSYDVAKQTAAGQIASGKAVDIEDIINKGAYDEQTSNENAAYNINSIRDDIQNRQENAQQELNQNLKNIDDQVQIEKQKAAASGRQEFSQIKPEDTGQEFLSKYKSISEKPAFQRTTEERLFLNNIPQTDEVQRAVLTFNKSPFSRSAEEVNFLKDFTNGKENQYIKERLQNQNQRINDIDEKLNSQESQPEGIEKSDLETEKKSLLESNIEANKRLNSIEGRPIRSKSIENLENKRDQIKSNIQDLDEQRRRLNIVNDLDNTAFPATDLEQIKSNSDHVKSYKGDSWFNESENTAFKSEIGSIDPNILEDLENARNLAEPYLNDLTENEQQVLNSFDEADNNFESFKESLNNLKKCLLEND